MVELLPCPIARNKQFFKTLLVPPILLLLCLNRSHADDVLTGISARLLQTPITQGVFQQEKQLKFLHKPLLSTGKFTYDQSKGVIWKTLSPVPSLLLIIDGHMVSGQGEQAVPPAFARVFKALLGGKLYSLTDTFDITGKEQKTFWQLQLTPKDELLKKIIRTIRLTGDTELRLLELQEANSNLTRVNFTEITHPERLNSEQQSDFERLSP